VAVFGAARNWYGDRVARLAIITLACWPASMFLWVFYSEALFVTVTAGAFWAHRTDRRRIALALVFAAGLTRSPGLLLGPVLAVAHLWACGALTERSTWRRAAPVAGAYALASAAAAGVLVFIGGVVAGDPLAFSHAQLGWGRRLSPPWTPVAEGLAHIVDVLPGFAGETTMNAVTTILLLAVGAWGVVAAWRRAAAPGPSDRPRDGFPLSPGLWTLVVTLMPQFTLLLTSMVRFALGAWTVFVLLAVAFQDRPVLRAAWWFVTAALSAVLLARLSQGQFVA
jgi:hypothetical protein